MDQKLKNYSSGMQVRLAFSVATRSKADILLVDEVLAVGDADFQKKCFDYFKKLKREDITVVFVSHDMSAIQQYCDRAALIEKSRLVSIDKASKIAVMYSKLFMHDDQQIKPKVKKGVKSPSGEERWGDFWAEWKDVSIKPIRKNNLDETDMFRIIAKGVANRDIEQPIFGFSIKDADFKQLVGTNTIRRNVEVRSLRAGEEFTVTWEMPNILNKGKHYIDCTIAHDQASSVSDRWPDAAEFDVFRVEDNQYPVYAPGIECKIGN